MNELLPLPHDISLTPTGRTAIWIVLGIILYSAWRWSHLGRAFQQGGVRYFIYGILATLAVTVVSFGIVIVIGLVFIGTVNNTSPSQNATMTTLVMALILALGYGIRRYFWRKLQRERRDELDDIGKNQ